MRLKVKILKLLAGRPVAILHKKTADKIGIYIDDRISISKKGKTTISIIDLATGLLDEKEIAVSQEIVKSLKLREDEYVEISIAPAPESSILIRKKLDCKTLNKKELRKIIEDIVNNALTEPEIAYFVTSIYKCGMTLQETADMINAIVKTGKTLKLKGKVVDKHSIGGVAGNRTTPLVVSICAATGLIMPKTSSRSITSAAGTADVIEAIAKIDFPIKKIYQIIKKTNACMVWGGSIKLAPADDKLIHIEKILSIDPEAQLLASILSKKISAGSKYVLIDIPYGKTAKIKTKQKARHLKLKFEKLAKKFSLKLKCVLTDGSQPIGNGIGPILEINDILRILKRENPPKDLESKSVYLAGKLFELAGKSKPGQGKKLAQAILDSGKAYKKFQEIIKAQQGSISPSRLKLGKFQHDITVKSSSKIKEIDNKKISFMARVAGSPEDKGAGLYLYKHKNQTLKKGEKLLTIYANTKTHIKEAIKFYEKYNPIKFY